MVENLSPHPKSVKGMWRKGTHLFFSWLIGWLALSHGVIFLNKTWLSDVWAVRPSLIQAGELLALWSWLWSTEDRAVTICWGYFRGYFSLDLGRQRNAQLHNSLQNTWKLKPSPLPGNGNSLDPSWRLTARNILLGLRFCLISAPLERADGAAKIKRDCWMEKKN